MNDCLSWNKSKAVNKFLSWDRSKAINKHFDGLEPVLAIKNVWERCSHTNGKGRKRGAVYWSDEMKLVLYKTQIYYNSEEDTKHHIKWW